MRARVRYKGRSIIVPAKKTWSLGPGLMFCGRESENLLFDMPGRWEIHSIFVFFPFLAVWVDEKGKVVDKRLVKPFTLRVKPRRKFAKLIEIPVNRRNSKIIRFFRR